MNDNTSQPLQIEVRGVRVHNLKGVDLDLPHHRLISVCGVSGSGKTSLAIDTLYAEGQRRYIESFSARTRQFVQVQEKADAERISGIPPAIAVTKSYGKSSGRPTVGTATEIQDFLSLLFAKISVLYCFDCQTPVRRDYPDSIAREIQRLPDGTRLMIGFATRPDELESVVDFKQRLQQAGFVRGFLTSESDQKEMQLLNLADPETEHQLQKVFPSRKQNRPGDDLDVSNNIKRSAHKSTPALHVIVDRIASNPEQTNRAIDSISTAMDAGQGKCFLMIDARESVTTIQADFPAAEIWQLDDAPYLRIDFNRELACAHCGISYPDPQPKLFSFTSALGACPKCEGYGRVPEFDMELIVPDPRKTLREGAIAPWTTPAYKHELEELLALADEFRIPVDTPFSRLSEEHRQLIWQGVPERKFGGLNGFFRWLEQRRYKLHLRVFYNRWRSHRACDVCEGDRFNELALAFQVQQQTIADLGQKPVSELLNWFNSLELSEHQQRIAHFIIEQIKTRLNYLCDVGLGYLTLNRSLNQLSGGEAQRVSLTAAIGSRLVNMLYVLDEPTAGLHASELGGIIRSVSHLAQRGNTVICVEHNPQVMQASEQVIEMGPEAGEQGGEVLFQGTFPGMLKAKKSVTRDFLLGKRGLFFADKRRPTKQGMMRLNEANGRNLKNLTVEFPINVLCLVTGVSGAGKSSLVTETLYPAVCKRLGKDFSAALEHRDVVGLGPIEDVILVDQSPIGRSPKSNPATFTKAFDPIRAVFAETVDAKTHNYKIGHFSFNSADGRCPTCNGDGYLTTDMKFLADVLTRCGDCEGTRYRQEILRAKYRGQSISDVLNMSVREAFSFFRGQKKVQASLRQLLEVGLDYLRLGQPASTLSTGEAQRLKLASHLANVKRKRTLFILDEPTSGLHFSDIVKLEDCFQSLLNVGHSLIVISHNLQLMRGADYIIDLGPGAADAGGRIVATGTPEQIAACPESLTGRALKRALQGDWTYDDPQ
jgi:excinuclease ABC subunit A